MNLAPRLARAAAAFALACVLGACATVNTVEPANPSATPNRVNDKRIITDGTLNDTAYVVEVYEDTVSGNLKRIQVKLRNMTATVKNVNYQFEWYDQGGMKIDSPSTTWRIAVLEGGQIVPVVSVAPTPAAVDWKLTLMESVRRTSTPLP